MFTSTPGVAILSEAKLLKEQTRAKNKETLLEIINSEGLSDVVVSINGNAVDVVVNEAVLDDVMRAQIEDIVKRKTEIAPENIIISTVVQ